ncbi:MAG: MFS transporter [Pseudorhodoplanes sp.]|jgi:predicted MFS family arabinose efflux permease|nr:MFS transporter [Pseudorhodoplanes sp.]
MTRELSVVALIVFVTSLFTRSVDPVIPQIADGLSVEIAMAALLSTAFALPYAIVQPVLGALADMMSKTRLMTVCLILLVLSTLVSALAPNYTVLMVSRAVAGIAAGGVFPIALAAAGDRVPVKMRQVAIGRLLAAAMIGNLMGASVSGVIGDLAGWRAVFFVTGALGVLVMITAFVGFRNVPKEETTGFDLSTLGPNYRAIFGNPQAKYCYSAVFFEALFLFGLFPHMAALLVESGEPRASIAGIVIAGFGAGAIVYTFVVGWLLSRVGEMRLMLGGGLIMALCYLLISLRLPWPIEFLVFVLMGFGFYWLHGCIQVYATELAPAARGSAMALHSAFFFVGQAAGPVVYGVGFAYLGKTPMLLIAAVVIAVTGFVCSQRLRRAPAVTT